MKSNILTRTLPKCVLTALAVLTLAACSDYDNGYTEKQLQFIQNFKDIYGEVDPTQDWNLAERANVTVTTSSPTNVKIYAKTGGKYKIIGDYQDVMGTRTLGFDVVEGTKNIMVSNGSKALFTTVGESVSFERTRTIVEEELNLGNNSMGVSYAKEENEGYTRFPQKILEKILGTGEEDEDAILPEEKFNLDKVTQDFYFVSQGPFVIYPIYWNTSSADVLGIYWKDDAGKIHLQEVYKMKDGDDLATYNTETKTYDATEVNKSNESLDYRYLDDKFEIASRGIAIDIPEGMEFGFYLDVYNKIEDGVNKGYCHTVYSQSGMNKVYGLIDPKDRIQDLWDGTNFHGTYDFGATFSATIDYTMDDVSYNTSYKFFCFEDWNQKGPDLNDIVFVFGKRNVPVTVDEDAPSWIISAEDLGNTLDIDYNDVVIEVEHVFGQDELYVTPLAAGGTLASFVYFNGQSLGEIHKMLGDNTTTISGQFQPINVFNTKPTEEGDEIVITGIPDGFTLTEVENVTNDNDKIKEASTMGGFKILVVPSTYEATEENAVDKGQTIQNNLTEEGYKAPFVICTPKIWVRDEEGADGMAGHYRWPKENVPMKKTNGYGDPAYDTPQHSFAEWVADKSKAQDWYKYPDITITCAPSLPLHMDDKTETVKKLPSEFSLLTDNVIEITIEETYTAYNESEGFGDKIKYIIMRGGETPSQSGNNITITSNNENVVQTGVDGNGYKYFTAVGAGTAVLTIHLEENTKYGSAPDLTVTITVTKKDGTFKIGSDGWDQNASENINVDLLPDGTYKIYPYNGNSTGMNENVTYSSSKEDVATVSADGTITAHNVGTATITVTSAGSEIYKSKSAYVNVTVEEGSGSYSRVECKVVATNQDPYNNNYYYDIYSLEIPEAFGMGSKLTINYTGAIWNIELREVGTNGAAYGTPLENANNAENGYTFPNGNYAGKTIYAVIWHGSENNGIEITSVNISKE